MPSFNPLHIPVDNFYSAKATNPLPTAYAGPIGGGGSYRVYPPQPQQGYHFGAAGQPSYPPAPPHYYQHHGQPIAPYDPTYSPSRFVQPSLHSQSYGFPAAPQSTVYSGGPPAPLARRNSVVDYPHPPPQRARPPVSDYSSLAGALDASCGPTRARSNSTHKHALVAPYKTVVRGRRGSKQIGPVLPDGPSDHVRVPQAAYEEPVTELGFQRIDHYRLKPVVFQHKIMPTPGIRLVDVDGEGCPWLEGTEDHILEGQFPYREFKMRVLWPGYPPFHKRVKTQTGRRGLLLLLAAEAVTASMGVAQATSPKRGFEAWAIGKRHEHGLRLEDILITGMEHRGGANFQVEIWVPKHRIGNA